MYILGEETGVPWIIDPHCVFDVAVDALPPLITPGDNLGAKGGADNTCCKPKHNIYKTKLTSN